jgi:hypothetical protein
MNRRLRYAVGLGTVVGLVAAYYALPVALGVISLGEICAYSPLGTNLCGSSSQTGTPHPPKIREVVACREDGVRYVGTSPEGAEVCFTVSSDGREVIETGVSLVRASACPDGALGGLYSNSPAIVDSFGHVFEGDTGLRATIRGAEASGVFAAAEICAGKTFKWTARRAS